MSQLYTNSSGRPVVKTPDGVEHTLAFTTETPGKYVLSMSAAEYRPNYAGSTYLSPGSIFTIGWKNTYEQNAADLTKLYISTPSSPVTMSFNKDLKYGYCIFSNSYV